ncbi:MAG: dCMP deaminase family protein [Firmicutes bacterium]|nr:dCMP deaminase family protein [Bacillota bacterium]
MQGGDGLRPGWDEYFLRLAELVAERATCPRQHVGAVLVRERRILATGYNGAPRGLPHCTEVGCSLYGEHCTRAVHAELNALLQCARFGVAAEGATLYCTHTPCLECAKALVNAGVHEVVYRHPYADDRANVEALLREAGLVLRRGPEGDGAGAARGTGASGEGGARAE